MDKKRLELLVLAAKAAGIECEQWRFGCGNALPLAKPYKFSIYWNPIDDDANAFRLAVRLGISFTYDRSKSLAWVQKPFIEVSRDDLVDFDENAATRLAIVRAAAEIGRST